MIYSQKYCLVSFIKPIDIGTEFDMTDWPPHITLADVFAIDLEGTNIETKLVEMLANQPSVTVTAGIETTLGDAKIVLLDKNDVLVKLHNDLIELLEANGAVFNTPQFIKEGFMPHVTVQKTGNLHEGETLKIDTMALVDMFPNDNWQQRKVLKTIHHMSDL